MTAMLPSRPRGADRATRAGEVVDPDTVLSRPAVGERPRIASTLRLRRGGREIVAVLDPVRARPVAGDHERSDQQVVEAAAERLTTFLQPGELVAATDAANPMGRIGDCYDDIAPVALFLASEDCRYLTGNTLFVDGGSHINGSAWAPDLD